MTRTNSFSDINHYQAKTQIKERFNKILTDLQKTVEQNGYAVQAVQRFRGCLENPENSDVSRLPVFAPVPACPKPNKILCVLHLISYTVQLYWAFCASGQKHRESLTGYLTSLEIIVEKTLKHLKVVEVPSSLGYRLKGIE